MSSHQSHPAASLVRAQALYGELFYATKLTLLLIEVTNRSVMYLNSHRIIVNKTGKSVKLRVLHG